MHHTYSSFVIEKNKVQTPKGQLKENRNLGSLGALSWFDKMAKVTFFFFNIKITWPLKPWFPMNEMIKIEP